MSPLSKSFLPSAKTRERDRAFSFRSIIHADFGREPADVSVQRDVQQGVGVRADPPIIGLPCDRHSVADTILIDPRLAPTGAHLRQIQGPTGAGVFLQRLNES